MYMCDFLKESVLCSSMMHNLRTEESMAQYKENEFRVMIIVLLCMVAAVIISVVVCLCYCWPQPGIPSIRPRTISVASMTEQSRTTAA
jgi:hypothetical protein